MMYIEINISNHYKLLPDVGYELGSWRYQVRKPVSVTTEVVFKCTQWVSNQFSSPNYKTETESVHMSGSVNVA